MSNSVNAKSLDVFYFPIIRFRPCVVVAIVHFYYWLAVFCWVIAVAKEGTPAVNDRPLLGCMGYFAEGVFEVVYDKVGFSFGAVF